MSDWEDLRRRVGSISRLDDGPRYLGPALPYSGRELLPPSYAVYLMTWEDRHGDVDWEWCMAPALHDAECWFQAVHPCVKPWMLRRVTADLCETQRAAGRAPCADAGPRAQAAARASLRRAEAAE